MCEPTTLLGISLGLSALKAGADYENQRSTASRQADALNRANALEQNDLVRQRDQQREAAASEMNDHAKAAQRDAALFDVVTGEFGGGRTADRASAVQAVQSGEDLSTISTNSTNRLGEIGFQSIGVNSRTKSQLASISHPSLFGTALQIGGAAVDYQTGMNKAKKDKSLNG